MMISVLRLSLSLSLFLPVNVCVIREVAGLQILGGSTQLVVVLQVLGEWN